MTTIRSAPPPMIPPRPANDARAAFFRQVAAPAQAQVQPPPPVVVQRPQAQTQAPQPERILRPGSFIDIKV